MGTDIHGTVEYKDGAEWKFAFSIEDQLGRSYDMFGLLFGVRNYANFKPVAPSRGVPDDITLDTWAILDPDDIDPKTNYHSLSWITMKEINSIDLEKWSLKRDERVHEYTKTKKGLIFRGKSKGKPVSLTKDNKASALSKEQYAQLENFYKLELGNSVYAYEFVQARNCLHFDRKLQAKLDELSREYGAENVRLVVGFDA